MDSNSKVLRSRCCTRIQCRLSQGEESAERRSLSEVRHRKSFKEVEAEVYNGSRLLGGTLACGDTGETVARSILRGEDSACIGKAVRCLSLVVLSHTLNVAAAHLGLRNVPLAIREDIVNRIGSERVKVTTVDNWRTEGNKLLQTCGGRFEERALLLLFDFSHVQLREMSAEDVTDVKVQAES